MNILVTSTDVMMIQFLVPHIINLKKKGYHIDIACAGAAGYENENYLEKISAQLGSDSQTNFVRTERNPLSLHNYKGYEDLCKVINNGCYDLIWTNEPVMGVMTRLAARKARSKQNAKVMYLVHGFHFFKGAPKKNWIYYPVEKVMAHFCDAMTMINWEDYHFAQKHFASVPLYHIDGIGLDTKKFSDVIVNREKKRKELGFGLNELLLLSVGELLTHKNHEVIIRALAQLKDIDIKYVICGCGDLEQYYRNLAEELGVNERLCLLGHRYDIPEVLKVVDIFAQPSTREGLGIAAIEAMSSGLPIITSNVGGIPDYSKNGETGFCLDPHDVDGFANAIRTLATDKALREKIALRNVEVAKKYDIDNSCEQIENIISEILSEKK